ncbi:hypothetical protein [Cupriavidus agavae]|uniref:Uncharacterized protein n=1 Tax=Cupriavidus agavae TaxID=1001822 RepID=A0A4Q7RRV5_9BURK|nr:hypothetical protein [Cupriavidus agavae]RZT36411.1 hypothetical protein EV147_3730 [Cupriavidus agavae]
MKRWKIWSAALAWAAGPAMAAQEACVEVEVNGARAPSYSCLTQQLAPASTGRAQRPVTLGAEVIAGQPSNQLGLYNRAATSHRMGNTFGTSVLPQRPDAPAPR